MDDNGCKLELILKIISLKIFFKKYVLEQQDLYDLVVLHLGTYAGSF